jgi:hypothetical protein
MELIPILSLIILVATISTFILAVGAYILYKSRERKGKTAKAPQPAAVPAELVTPTPIVSQQRGATGGRATYSGERYPTRGEAPELRRQAYGPQEGQQQHEGPDLRPTYVSPTGTNYTESRYQRPSYDDSRQTRETSEGQYGGKRKFMRYTNEGYIEPSDEKNKEDNLKWR